MNWSTICFIVSFLWPIAVLVIATILGKHGVSEETTRKTVHVGVSNWIIFAVIGFKSGWYASILPFLFIFVNAYSAKKGLISAMERSENNTFGTVWYAVSLLILTFTGFMLKKPWIALTGVLAMGYGDGLAAVVGVRLGRHHFPAPYEKKSLEGSLSVMLISGLVAGIACYFYRDATYPSYFLHVALACAVPAGVIELFTPRGLDNLSLPLSVGGIAYLLDVCPEAFPAFLSLGIGMLILLAAFYLRAITVEAFWVASLLGILIFLFSGWPGFLALILFFCVGSVVSFVGKKRKKESLFVHEHEGARVISQVLANGLPSLLFAVLYFITKQEFFLLIVILCFAADTADTFSSELGMLSKKTPVSILSFKPVQKGLSGGVTLLGFAGAFLGALCLSCLAYPRFGLTGVLLVILAGLFDSCVDSVLGAALQAKYAAADGGRQRITERPSIDGKALKLIHGVRWITNDWVNFLSVLITGVVFSPIAWLALR